MNGKVLNPAWSDWLHGQNTAENRATEGGRIQEIISVRVLKINLIAISFLYAQSSFNFFLLTFFLKYFPGNLFENAVYFALSDLVAFVSAGTILKYTSTSTTIRIGAVMALLGSGSYLIAYTNLSLVPITLSLARIGQSIMFNTSIISVGRLFSTNLVSTAYGFVNLASHIFACLSPFAAELTPPIPFFVFILLILIGIVSTFYLTETNTAARPENNSPDQIKDSWSTKL